MIDSHRKGIKDSHTVNWMSMDFDKIVDKQLLERLNGINARLNDIK